MGQHAVVAAWHLGGQNRFTINIRATAIPRILFPMDTPLPSDLDSQPLSEGIIAYRRDVPVPVSKDITGVIADTEQSQVLTHNAVSEIMGIIADPVDPQVISHILSGRSFNPEKMKQ